MALVALSNHSAKEHFFFLKQKKNYAFVWAKTVFFIFIFVFVAMKNENK
jgi:hypothetical protein